MRKSGLFGFMTLCANANSHALNLPRGYRPVLIGKKDKTTKAGRAYILYKDQCPTDPNPFENFILANADR